MPIYEYACHRCRKIYQFFSKTTAVERSPKCPKCGADDLERALSTFAPIHASKTKEARSSEADEMAGRPDGGDGLMDDPFERMSPSQRAAAEREMMRLMSDAESLDENDPRQMGHFMERMGQIAGVEDKAMQEAIRRLKDGEDPEKIEEDMGDDMLGGEGGGGGMGGYGADPGIYDF